MLEARLAPTAQRWGSCGPESDQRDESDDRVSESRRRKRRRRVEMSSSLLEARFPSSIIQ
jgi:hypothetical protein